VSAPVRWFVKHAAPARNLERQAVMGGRDVLGLAGVALAVLAVAGAQAVEGGRLVSLINVPALIIVLGGTAGAAMAQASWPQFVLAVRRIKWVLHPPPDDRQQRITKALLWSDVVRREGVLSIERHLEAERDPMFRKGLQLIADGVDQQAVRDSLAISLRMREARDLEIVRVFDAMGGYAPTIGILGAVMGLVQVMDHLDDPEQLGVGIARAFVATIYGVALANIVILPWANRMRSIVVRRSESDELVIDGLAAIAAGEITPLIRTRLAGYVEERRQ